MNIPHTTRRRGLRVAAAATAAATFGLVTNDIAAAQEDGINSVERIVFTSGEDSASFRDYNPGGTNRYLVQAAAGQEMSVQLAPSDGAPTFDVYAPDGTVLATDSTSATVALPADGDYVVDVSIAGDDSDFRLSTTIPDTGNGGGDGGINSVERIVFQGGEDSATFRDYNPGGTNRYLVYGGPAQNMSVEIAAEDGGPTFDVYAPDGTVLATDTTSTTVPLTAEGDYVIDVQVDGDDSDFWLTSWIS